MITTSALQPELLEAVSHFVEARLGLHYPRERWIDLERGLERTAEELGFESAEECAREMVHSRLRSEQLASLAAHLTIGETYFFRDPAAFTALETQVIPSILLSRHERLTKCLRIWSAGCCTGEEPYSIAISLRRALPSLQGWQVSILATDVNSRFLQKAVQGVYGQWSFRGVPDSVKRAFFKRTRDGRYEVIREIRQMVEFTCLNLVEDVFPSLTTNTNALDIIFCRNVLMYFSRDQMRHVAARLTRALAPGGWLFVSPAEAAHDLFPDLTPAKLPGTTAFLNKTPGPEVEDLGLRQPCCRFLEGSPAAVKDPAADFMDLAPPTGVAQANDAANSNTHGEAKEEEEKQEQEQDKLLTTARTLANQGHLTEALAACDAALEFDKLDPATHYVRGVILHEQNAIGEALLAIKRALFLDPDFVVAHFSLGQLHLRQDRTREARRSFENARLLLQAREPGFVLPESDGITAERMLAMLESLQEVAA